MLVSVVQEKKCQMPIFFPSYHELRLHCSLSLPYIQIIYIIIDYQLRSIVVVLYLAATWFGQLFIYLPLGGFAS